MKRIQLLGALFLLGWISNAHASTLMFTDQTAWNSRVFDAGLIPTSVDLQHSINSVTGGPDLNTTVWVVTAGDVVFSSSGLSLEANNGVLVPGGRQNISVKLPNSVYALGFELGDFGVVSNPPGPPYISNVILSNGDVFAGPYYGVSSPYVGPDSPANLQFFGFLSDNPITGLSMFVSSQVTDPFTLNYTYAKATEAAPVPEPMSFLLLGSGIGFMGIMQRRRRG